MLAAIRAKTWLRAAVGVGCAYALALQMLLAGAVATQMAAAGPVDGIICISGHSPDSQDDNNGGRVPHFHCVVCALVTFGSPPLDTVQGQPFPVVVAAGTQAAVTASASLNRRHTPRSSQGPPQTA